MQRNSKERAAMLKRRAEGQRSRVEGVTFVPASRRQRGKLISSPSWCTKKWTKMRRPEWAKK